MSTIRTGPLKDVIVLELAGLAPGPFCGMILSDFGAKVIRIDRVDSDGNTQSNSIDQLTRGKESIAIDLKSKQGRDIVLKLCEKSQVIIDPFRPGVMEKLGLSPKECHLRNPNLIFARLTGFGQTGENYHKMAGHDINYLALSGMLSLFGRSNEPPIFPGNLLADFAGGGLMCALGILLSLLDKTSVNKIVDCSMMSSVAYLGTFAYLLKERPQEDSIPLWSNPRGKNMLDSGAHFYEIYETKDNRYISVGAIEPQFYQSLLIGLGLESKINDLPDQNDESKWPEMKQLFKDIFKSKSRDEWESIFINTDSCVAPVLELNEIKNHPHSSKLIFNQDKSSILPQPNLSFFNNNKDNIKNQAPISIPGSNTISILKEFGFSLNEIDNFQKLKIIPIINSKL